MKTDTIVSKMQVPVSELALDRVQIRVYVTSKTYASLQRESQKTGKEIPELVSKLIGRKVTSVVVSDD